MFKQVKTRVLARRALNSSYKSKHLKHSWSWKNDMRETFFEKFVTFT